MHSLTCIHSPLTKIVQDMITPIKCHIMRHNNHQPEPTPELTNKTHLCNLLKVLLHGNVFTQQTKISQVHLNQSAWWLTKVQLRGKTEAVLCTARGQMLETNKG